MSETYPVKLKRRHHVLLAEAKEAERLAAREWIHYSDNGGMMTKFMAAKAAYHDARRRVDEMQKDEGTTP